MENKIQGLYVSGDISKTSTSLAAVKSYLQAIRPITIHIDALFEALFPKWHRLYWDAFEAGVMFPEDFGPFFGKAVVFKLQGKLHKDNRDVGPSVSFAVGYYTGGDVYFPQLNAKLR